MEERWLNMPRCSMYGIFTYMYPTNGPNVGKYSIHGAFGMGKTIRNRNKLEIYLGTTFQLDRSKQYWWWNTIQTGFISVPQNDGKNTKIDGQHGILSIMLLLLHGYTMLYHVIFQYWKEFSNNTSVSWLGILHSKTEGSLMIRGSERRNLGLSELPSGYWHSQGSPWKDPPCY